jgi:hypothetical protein
LTKARSKTGCITCRKRKKKCDETRPFCKTIHTGLSVHADLNRQFVQEEQYPL